MCLHQGSQTQIAPRAKLGPIKQLEDRIMMLTQQWRYLNLTSNSLCILFPAKCIVSCRQIISNRLYVRLKKRLVHSSAEHFQTSVNKLKNLNVDYIKIAKAHRGHRHSQGGQKGHAPQIFRKYSHFVL